MRLALATLAVLLVQSVPTPKAAAVKVDNFSFTPPTLTVAEGTTVTWTNDDDVPHTIVAVQGAFRSKALDTDDKFTFTFAKPGTYKYYCSVHPRMVGTVIVKP